LDVQTSCVLDGLKIIQSENDFKRLGSLPLSNITVSRRKDEKEIYTKSELCFRFQMHDFFVLR